MGHLVSVNVGSARTVGTGRGGVRTAIWKTPTRGRVAVRGVNLDGDEQADRSVHGGPDKAVYAYAVEEIREWERELGRELGPAAFGENLTTEGIDVSGALVGERWRVGTALLEVVQPRLPCSKLGLRMADPGFVRRFGQASRPGAYLRIIEGGELGAGDEVQVDVASRPDHGVTVRLVSDAILIDPGLIPQVLRAPELLPSLRVWMVGRRSVLAATARVEAAAPRAAMTTPRRRAR
jgi:MOSC domain-containing protein YiiM